MVPEPEAKVLLVSLLRKPDPRLKPTSSGTLALKFKKMGSQTYRHFIKVLEKWPIDSLKKGKDIGEGLRSILTTNFPAGPNSVLADEKYVKRQINASKLLCDDHFIKKYPRISDSTFTGVNLENLKQITSVENMSEITEQANQPALGLFAKIKHSLPFGNDDKQEPLR